MKSINTYNNPFKNIERILPIPLHATRLRERGFNQAELLARMLSQRLNIPLSTNNLRRIHNTKNQARLSQKERWTNIQGAFRIKDSREFRAKSILIIDDLYTTGATASEIARLLKDAKAKEVFVLTLAIAIKA